MLPTYCLLDPPSRQPPRKPQLTQNYEQYHERVLVHAFLLIEKERYLRVLFVDQVPLSSLTGATGVVTELHRRHRDTNEESL